MRAALAIVGFVLMVCWLIGALALAVGHHDAVPAPTPMPTQFVDEWGAGLPPKIRPLVVVPRPSPSVASRSYVRRGLVMTRPMWFELADCETVGHVNGQIDWQSHSNEFEGGLQLLPGPDSRGKIWHESPDQQIARAEVIFERQGIRAWPDCARRLGWSR